MKICHLINSYPLPTGGMQTYCFELAERQAELGHEVSVYVSGVVDKSISHKNVVVESFKPLFHIGKAAFSPLLIFKFLKDKFDVIHIHLPFPLNFELVLMVAKFNRIPIVATYHCVIANYKNNSFNGVLLNIYNSLNIKLLGLIDHLIFTTKDYSKLFNFPKSKVSIIPIGVETDRFKPFNRTLSRKFINLPKDKFIILFVGNIDIHNYCKKGVEYLLKAIPLIRAYIPNVFLDLVGTTDIESKQIIDNISKKERITDIVHISGFVKNEDLPIHYASSNIFVLPSVSRLEAFGIVLIEALASGIPIIATNITGVRSVVRSSKAGFLIEPGSINDIVKKVVAVSRLKNLDNFAIETVKNKYEWVTIVKDILDIYKNLTYLK